MANPPTPSNVSIIYSSGNDIECTYTFTPLPTNPTNFEFVWGTTNNPTDPGNTTVASQGIGQFNTVRAEFLVTTNTLVYIWGKISNKPGSGSSQVNYSSLGTTFQSGSSNQPGTPYLTNLDSAGNITVNFQTTQAPGTQLLIVYGTDPNAGANQNYENVTLVTSPDIWGTQPFAVPQGVDVYIWARATTFSTGTFYSNPPMVYNSSIGGGNVTTPELVAEDLPSKTITVNFQTTPIYGVTQTFNVVYSTVNNPIGPEATTNTAFNVSGDTWGSGPFQVKPNVNIYIWARSEFQGTTVYSQTPLVYNTDTTGIPPSGPSTTPALLNRTNTSITVSFSTAGITGTAPIDVLCNASTSPSGPFDKTCKILGNAPSYNAEIQNLQPNTSYYFQTVVYNATLPNRPSAVSAGFKTTDIAQVDPPIATDVEATQITMRFNVPVSSFVSAQKTALLRWGTKNTGASPLPNVVPTTYLGLVNGNPTWEATVYNLTPGVTYYFQGAYAPIGISTIVPVATERGNTFDLGYMPPRGWATPNPVIVSGISLPWRQT